MANTDREAIGAAAEVTSDTDLPMLTCLLGAAPSKATMPPGKLVRSALGLDSPETLEVFKVESSVDYGGGRVLEFRGMLAVKDDDAEARLGALLVRGEAEARRTLPAPLKAFLQPGDAAGEARLFVFLAADLPHLDAAEGEDGGGDSDLGASFARGVLLGISALFCVLQFLRVALEYSDISNLADLSLDSITAAAETASDLWVLGPLLLLPVAAAMAARALVASAFGIEVGQAVLPSFTIGHLGSFWQPRGFLPSQRVEFDLAASGPLASFLVSAALLALGTWQMAGLEPSSAPAEVPAIHLPAAIAAAMGYPVPALPVVGEEAPLFSMSSPDPAALPSTDGPAVPANPCFLAGVWGLAATCATLLPVGSFDGYTLARAAYGRGFATLLEVVAIFGLIGELSRDDFRGSFASDVVFAWVLQWAFGRRRGEAMPPQDCASPVGVERQALAAALLVVAVVVLAPP